MTGEILTVAQIAAADAAAAAAGVPTLQLMENAGRAVADAIGRRWTPRPTAVLCGPGNNGGDGYVVARILRERGWDVWVEYLADPASLNGDASSMARSWTGPSMPISESNRMAELFVDALFGAGLSRPLQNHARRLASASHRMAGRIVAVDVPSGLHGDRAAPLGDVAFRADVTVTFARPKPAHVLEPGRSLCGDVEVADIGIPDAVIAEQSVACRRNTPDLWSLAWPSPPPVSHKYDRGHTVVVSGGAASTGAARLAAQGALRVGSGLVTVAAPPGAVLVNAAHLTAVMVRSADGSAGLAALLADRRRNSVVLGPGLGVGPATRDLVETALASTAAVTLDADALTSFETDPEALFAALRSPAVLTPHAGEFERLFPGVLASASNRIEAARQAARRSRAVVVLKGRDTVIAAPDGRAAVNEGAPPSLATAGSGDVLAGLVGGLLAQAMPAFEAACAGVWVHGRAASRFGRGLTADDLPHLIPAAVSEVCDRRFALHARLS